MSWCGGGEINPTPGVEWRTLAMILSTLCPGSWPPSPGFAPCAILICIMSELTRYSVVTPKRPETVGLLAAFAGVRSTTDAVHGDGERGMRLARDRAERHGAGGEAAHDVLCGLHFLDRQRFSPVLLRRFEQEQAADGEEAL